MPSKVVVLTTGGTIGHQSRSGVAVPGFDPSALAPVAGLDDLDLEFRAVFAKGSMEIVPDDWVVLAGAVHDALLEEPRGVVVLHGTDTMHYTAAALSFALRGFACPVVMTGSMRPGGDENSDAVPNLRDALRVAAAADLNEVCIVFSADAERSRAVIIRGTRARKMHSTAIDAFASINAPPIGYVEDGAVTLLTPGQGGVRAGPPQLSARFNRDVLLTKLTPALRPDTLAWQLQKASGVVLEGTGVGHIRADLQDVVAAFGKPAVITTQAAFGGERLGSYDADRAILALPNLVRGGDMTSEAALVKLMWALEQDGDIRGLMQSNLAGETGDAPGRPS